MIQTMYHDESTPPLPRPKRSRSAHARYSMPSQIDGRIIAHAPPPPPERGPSPIIAPPPPPKLAVNKASNINRVQQHRYSMPAKIPQSTTESVPRDHTLRSNHSNPPNHLPQTRKRGHTTPHRVSSHPPPPPPKIPSSSTPRPRSNNLSKKRPPKRVRSKSSRRRQSSQSTKSRERSQSQKHRVHFEYDAEDGGHGGNAMNRLIGNSGGGHGHQYVALSGGACTTPTITHISQYNNFNHFDVHHYPQSAKATTTSSNANRFFPVAATKSIPTPALPIEEQLLQQSQHSQHHLLLQREQRMSLSDRWAMATSQSEVTEQESLHRNVRKLKIIRNGTDLHQQLHGLEVIHSDGGSLHAPHSPAAHDRDSRRQRQSSDPNIRSMRSPSLPPLSEHTAGSRRSKSRDRGHSLMLRERVNPRRVRRSKLRVIRDQRKGSDPQGFRSRTADRDRAGTKSMSTGTGSLRHSDDEKASEPLTVTDDGGTLSVSAGVRSDHDHHDHHDRYDHHIDDRRLTAKRMSKHCHLRFFVEMNGVWTYSVRFDSALCGLELCPIDDR